MKQVKLKTQQIVMAYLHVLLLSISEIYPENIVKSYMDTNDKLWELCVSLVTCWTVLLFLWHMSNKKNEYDSGKIII